MNTPQSKLGMRLARTFFSQPRTGVKTASYTQSVSYPIALLTSCLLFASKRDREFGREVKDPYPYQLLHWAALRSIIHCDFGSGMYGGSCQRNGVRRKEEARTTFTFNFAMHLSLARAIVVVYSCFLPRNMNKTLKSGREIISGLWPYGFRRRYFVLSYPLI